jgi:hypothetical protein
MPTRFEDWRKQVEQREPRGPTERHELPRLVIVRPPAPKRNWALIGLRLWPLLAPLAALAFWIVVFVAGWVLGRTW